MEKRNSSIRTNKPNKPNQPKKLNVITNQKRTNKIKPTYVEFITEQIKNF